jgi:Mlc titration factor MtfA (ptsG expression regulator)
VVFAYLLFLSLLVLLGVAVLRQQSRRRLAAASPPQCWIDIVETNLPLALKLSPDQRKNLFSAMQLFLTKKKFEGCGGLEITEEIRVTVAAQACMLLLGRKTPVYPKLKTILIYPHTYRSGQKGLFGSDNGNSTRLGESWECGVIILAWDSVLGGARNMEDGQNVTFHEFAHQLDQEDGAADGAPILEHRSAYSTWGRVFRREYKQLIDKTRGGRKTVMDRYGATNPAEFFAVATETFFEKPKQLKTRHPELYEELQAYYHVDPLQWNNV